jgi:metal-responsive CopG/Arc/MetJ family transcriptional regulator
MGRRDWYYVHLPKLLIKRLDQFLQTPRAKSMGMANKSELLRHVINEFLDEQEAFYNKMESMEDFVLEIKDHDHIVLTFNNESQFKEIITAFVKRGIDYNQINALIIYRKEEQKFLQSLDKFPNINYLFNLQDIMIIPADESFHNDNFSVEPVVKRLRSIEQLAKERSKKGLNILATLPAKLIEQGRYEDAVKIENVFNIAIGEFEQPITLSV